MARALFALLLLSALALSSANTCPSTGGCPTTAPKCTNCPNCETTITCTCKPNPAPTCPSLTCGTVSGPDGCGGSVSSNCQCPSGYACQGSGKCCETSCKTTVTSSTGQKYTLNGTCASTQPANTIKGGPCSSGCGTCYISSFDPNLCPATPNGQCSKTGKCGCFGTYSGGSCAASNFLSPVPSPLPGNGGGCQENLCNAVAAQNGISAACCPSGCKN
ncbi:hypothetical protein KFL_001220120 [Klebsormidium nitens]|uniref:EGF-like domain-containing protein n=1 Tax=Klebsormidium nitens TaxID=105231 RepID=A0A1Y1HVT9_KLENI|nr:hypothetical protein KFL_001220120 [Klebsormidium nitens]|eukprot:GAQ82744.1 hypothetical protein KFL_001220120 [Klebsormidium nitens]